MFGHDVDNSLNLLEVKVLVTAVQTFIFELSRGEQVAGERMFQRVADEGVEFHGRWCYASDCSLFLAMLSVRMMMAAPKAMITKAMKNSLLMAGHCQW